MLVCSVSLRAPRRAISSELAEAATAVDALGTGNVVFATLVDDPASVGEIVDAYLGEIMLEAASATDVVSFGFIYTAAVDEVLTATETSSAASAITPATINGTLSRFVITNGGLTATRNSTLDGGAASASFKSTGKFYYEFTPVVWAGSLYSGVMLSTGAVDDSAGINNTAVFFGGGSTLVYTNGSATAKNLGATVAGNIFAGAIDLTNRLAWFRRSNGNWNGDAAADPATGVGGVLLVAGSFAPWCRGSGAAGNLDRVDFNFGGSAFSGTVPSGYTSGWPV